MSVNAFMSGMQPMGNSVLSDLARLLHVEKSKAKINF